MRVAIIADQHGTLPTIPKCDLVICSGDLTGGNPHGPRDNSDAHWGNWLVNEFSNWACEFVKNHPGHRSVVAIAGNHDTCMETWGRYAGGRIRGVCVLLDDEVQDELLIYGTPWIRKWDTLAFNLPEDQLKSKWAKIPERTDILVCHQPPKGYGDDGKGCPRLTERIRQIKPKLVTCGHIHEGRGVYDLCGTMVVNASGGFITVDL